MCIDWEFIGAEEEMENPLNCVDRDDTGSVLLGSC